MKNNKDTKKITSEIKISEENEVEESIDSQVSGSEQLDDSDLEYNSDQSLHSDNEFASENEIDEGSEDITDSETEISKPLKSKVSKEELEKFRQKVEKTGVVYMSRVPPRMRADKLNKLLSRFKIPIGRIYLAPEDPRAAKKRKLAGGSRRKLYTEGWIEFMNKNKAKSLVKMINNTSMDPKKHSYHYDDMWNLKYLPKFKWNHLTERIAYEKEARAHRLRQEIAQAKKINTDYAAKVEKAKMIESMEAKKRLRSGVSGDSVRPVKVLRHFNQRPSHTSDLSVTNVTLSKKGSINKSNSKLDSVMDKIFG